MIIPEYSAIINIEVKRGSNDSSDKLNLLKDASDQTKQHFSFMQKLFGGMLSKDWVFVRAACVTYLEIAEDAVIPCGNCQQFILLYKDIKNKIPWLKHLIDNKLVASQNYYHDQTLYENLVAELVYHISIKESSRYNQLISDPLTISRETEKALTGKTEGISGESNVPVYMLNNEQLQAVHSPAKFLIIDGDYGTGKTYVLKEKAKKCATANIKHQIFYIDLTAIFQEYKDNNYEISTRSSVMNIISVVDFNSYSNIRVITVKDLDFISLGQTRIISSDLWTSSTQGIIKALNRFLRDNYCDHLFIDEMITGKYVFPSSIKTKYVFPESIKTICVNLKVDTEGEMLIKKIQLNHNAVHVNLTKNFRNSQQILRIAKDLEIKSPQQMLCCADTNVMGNHNFYYKNIYEISPSLLAVAAIKKYFINKPKESVVVLSEFDYLSPSNYVFELLNEHIKSTIPVVRDFKAYMEKPEGILVTNMNGFQGAQARNMVIFDQPGLRNAILRTMSFAIIIYGKDFDKLDGPDAIEDKNLHEYIYPEGKAPECHHYHNKYKHNISAVTMAILDKYKLFNQDESIVIITYKRISKDIIRDANTKEFLDLPEWERRCQVAKKIALENKELYEDVKRNISSSYADVSWSYYDHYEFSFKVNKADLDLKDKPRHINFINIHSVVDYADFSKLKNIIVFSDENIDHKYEFAAWEGMLSLNYFDDRTGIDVNRNKKERHKCDTFCRNTIMLSQPKFAIVVHDGNLDSFYLKGALNLIEDDDLHEHIPVPECHHYHNKHKHDISDLTMAVLDKYKLLDQDESITLITYSKMSKTFIREANTKEFLNLPKEERKKQIEEKIELENKKLYEDVKRNISSSYADVSCSYYELGFKVNKADLDLKNKTRHINFINVRSVADYADFGKLSNIIVFADENIDLMHQFATWGEEFSLNYSDDEESKEERHKCDTFCRNTIMSTQPKFAIVVHDGKLETFSQPEGALNLIEDDNLHEYIPVTNTNTMNDHKINSSTQDDNIDEHITVVDTNSITKDEQKPSIKRKNCCGIL